MDSCTILIPHIETPHLLYGSVNQIKKHTKNIDWEIIIADQSSNPVHLNIKEKYKNDKNIKVIKLPKIDAGHPIDIGVRQASKEYFCSLDVDAFPIHNNWLYLPINLIKEFNFSFIGHDTGLGKHLPYVEANGGWMHLNNYFRVSKTSLAKKVSENAGFCRYSSRQKTGLHYLNNEWNGAAGSDNGVVAQWWTEKNKLGPKLSLCLNKILGKTPEFGVYGMCIDDLVFHFVFGYHPDTISNANKSLGQEYLKIENKIKEEGLTDSNIEWLLKNLKDCYPYSSRASNITGGFSYLDVNSKLYQRIEELKKLEV